MMDDIKTDRLDGPEETRPGPQPCRMTNFWGELLLRKGLRIRGFITEGQFCGYPLAVVHVPHPKRPLGLRFLEDDMTSWESSRIFRLRDVRGFVRLSEAAARTTDPTLRPEAFPGEHAARTGLCRVCYQGHEAHENGCPARGDLPCVECGASFEHELDCSRRKARSTCPKCDWDDGEHAYGCPNAPQTPCGVASTVGPERIGEVHGQDICPSCVRVGILGRHHFVPAESLPKADGDMSPEHEAERRHNLAFWFQCLHCEAWAEPAQEEA